MAELNLADRPWSMHLHTLCNYMHSWYFSHSISALASGTGGYYKMQGPMSVSSFQMPHSCLFSGSPQSWLSGPLQFQVSFLSSHLHRSFISPSCITELLPGCWHMLLTHFSPQLSEMTISHQLQMLQST